MTYLLFLSKSLVSLSLSFLLSFAFLEERLGNEDLVLGRDGAVMSVYVQAFKIQITFQSLLSTWGMERVFNR